MRSLVPTLAILAAAGAGGCGPPLAHARLSEAEAPSPREDAAALRAKSERCPVMLGGLFPGLGHYCQRRDEEAVAVATVGVVDVTATAIAFVEEQPAAEKTSLIVLQDAWAYGAVDPILEQQRAARARYVPQDTLGELAVAPFNGRVLARPEVSGGIVVTSAVAFGLAMLVDRPGPGHPDAQPFVFGRPVARPLAYPLAGATFAAQFTHVAIAEETLFRGYLQSTLARACGQSCGWALGSYLFGGFHALNVFAIDDPKLRGRYLGLVVPYLVIVGQYFGGVYWMNRYSLATTVATHFWYDLLLSAADFVYDPQRSTISASVSLPL